MPRHKLSIDKTEDFVDEELQEIADMIGDFQVGGQTVHSRSPTPTTPGKITANKKKGRRSTSPAVSLGGTPNMSPRGGVPAGISFDDNLLLDVPGKRSATPTGRHSPGRHSPGRLTPGRYTPNRRQSLASEGSRKGSDGIHDLTELPEALHTYGNMSAGSGGRKTSSPLHELLLPAEAERRDSRDLFATGDLMLLDDDDDLGLSVFHTKTNNRKRKIAAAVCLFLIIAALTVVILLTVGGGGDDSTPELKEDTSGSGSASTGDLNNSTAEPTAAPSSTIITGFDQPRVDGIAATPGTANSVVSVGDFVFIADGEYGIQVFDVTAPEPVRVATLTEGINSTKVILITPERMLVADRSKDALYMIDISHPRTPKILHQYNVSNEGDIISSVPGEKSLDAFIVDTTSPVINDGDHLVGVVDGETGFYFVKFSDSSATKLMTMFAPPSSPTAVASISSKMIGFALIEHKFVVFDYSIIEKPLVLPKVIEFSTNGVSLTVDESTNMVVVLDEDEITHLIDVTNPLMPYQVSSIQLATSRRIQLLSAASYPTQTRLIGKVLIVASSGTLQLITLDENGDPTGTEQLSLTGVTGFEIKDSKMYVTCDRGIVAYSLDFKQATVEVTPAPAVPTDQPAADISWAKDQFISCLTTLEGMDINLKDYLTSDTLDINYYPPVDTLIAGFSDMLQFREPVERYFGFFNNSGFSGAKPSLDDVASIIQNNVPVAKLASNLHMEDIQVLSGYTNGELFITIITDMTARTTTAEGKRLTNTAYSSLLEGIQSLSALYDLAKVVAETVSVPDLSDSIYFESSVKMMFTFGISIGDDINKGTILTPSEIEAKTFFGISELSAYAKATVDPMNLAFNKQLSVSNGFLSTSLGVRFAPYTTGNNRILMSQLTASGVSLIEYVNAAMKKEVTASLDCVLPVKIGTLPLVPILEFHDSNLTDGVLSDFTMDVDLSFLIKGDNETDSYFSLVTSELNDMVSGISELDVLQAVPESFKPIFASALDDIKGVFDFTGVYGTYVRLLQAYRQLEGGLPREIRLDVTTAIRLAMSEQFAVDILAKLKSLGMIEFNKFDATTLQDGTGEIFSPLNYLTSVQVAVGVVSTLGDADPSFTVDDLGAVLAMQLQYSLSARNAVALLKLLPVDVQNEFSILTPNGYPAKVDGTTLFDPFDYVPQIASVIGTSEGITAVASRLSTIKCSFGQNDNFKQQAYTLISSKYPKLVSRYEAKSLSDPVTGAPFEWTNYLPELSQVLGLPAALQSPNDMSLLLGVNPSVQGFVNFMKNLFVSKMSEMLSAVQTVSTNSTTATFKGGIESDNGSLKLTTKLGLEFTLPEVTPNTVISGSLAEILGEVDLKELLGNRMERMLSNLQQLSSSGNWKFSAKLVLVVDAGLHLDPLFASVRSRPLVHLNIDTFDIELGVEASNYDNEMDFGTNLRFPVKAVSLNAMVGLKTETSSPITVIDESQGISFSLSNITANCEAYAMFAASVPIELPMMPGPVLLEIKNDNIREANNTEVKISSPKSGLPFDVSFKKKMFVVQITTSGADPIVLPIPLLNPITEQSLQETLTPLAGNPSVAIPACPMSAVSSTFGSNPIPLFFKPSSTLPVSLQNIDFDPCSLLSAAGTTSRDVGTLSADDPILRVSFDINPPGTLSVTPLELESINIELSAYKAATTTDRQLVVQGVTSLIPDLTWRGQLTAVATVFDTSCEIVAAVTSEFDLEILKGDCDVEMSLFNMKVETSYSSQQCTDKNSGAVTFNAPGIPFTASGHMSQKNGCNSQQEPLWIGSLSASSPDSSIGGVIIKDATLGMESYETTNSTTGWLGEITGTAEIGTSATVEGLIRFNSASSSIDEFILRGQLVMGPVSGTVLLSMIDEVAIGDANVSITLSNGDIPLIRTQLSHVLTYNHNNLWRPLWSVNGSLSELTLFGVTLRDVSMQLQAHPNLNGDMVWTGELQASSYFLASSEMKLTVVIADNKFGSLESNVTIEEGGIRFEGSTRIDAEYETTTCYSVQSVGSLEFVSLPGTSLDASLISNGKCADSPGAVVYSITATADTELEIVDEVVLKHAVAKVTAIYETQSKNTWEATISATANLFGSSSHAEVQFKNGAFESIELETSFTTIGGLVSGHFNILYYDGCNMDSTGRGNITIRLSGADDLHLEGEVTYNKCTGVVVIKSALASPWNGPFGIILTDLSVAVQSAGDGGNSSKLSTRTWNGTISASTPAGLTVVYNFDTASNSSSSAMLTYLDDRFSIMIGVDQSNCTGTGTVIATNLPYSIPSFEIDVSFSRPVCDQHDDAWQATGILRNMKIPFFGKTLEINDLTIVVSSDSIGAKNFSITGDYFDDFQMYIQADLPIKSPTDLVVKGVSKRVPMPLGQINQDFSSSSDPFGSGIGVGFSDVSNTLNAIELVDLTFDVDFNNMGVIIDAKTIVYGAEFTVGFSMQKHPDSKKWVYSMGVSTTELSKLSGLPSVVETSLQALNPTFFSLSMSTEAIEGNGIEYRKGLSLRLLLDFNSGMVHEAMQLSPSEMSAQIQDRQSPSTPGLVVIADLVSSKEIFIFAALSGGIDIVDDVSIRTLALCFKIGVQAEIGFLAEIDFALGTGSEKREFSASGYMGLGPVGVTIGLAIDSPTPWENPFGIQGLSVLFPLGIEMTISVALVPSKFNLFGGAQVSSVMGKIVIGANLVDFSKNAFKLEISGLTLRNIIVDIGKCTSCVKGNEDLVDGTGLDYLMGSFNPDPVNPVLISAGAITETIDPGIRFDVQGLVIMNSFRVERALFGLNASGIEAGLFLAPVSLSPFEITSSTNSSEGPSLYLALTITTRLLQIDGALTIFNYYASARAILSDDFIEVHVNFTMAGFSVEGSVVSVGYPGSSNYHLSISGALETGLINDMIDSAGDFLMTLTDEASSALDTANKGLQAAQASLQAANDELDRVKAETTADIKAAQDEVNAWITKQKNTQCPKCKPKVSWNSVTSCTQAVVCDATKAVASSLTLAEEGLALVEAGATAAIDVAQDGISLANDGVTAANDAVQYAQQGLQAFTDFMNQHGKLSNILGVSRIGFSVEKCTSPNPRVTFTADITIQGTPMTITYTASFDYDAIFKDILNEVRSFLKSALLP